jgi:hypothetical protein
MWSYTVLASIENCLQSQVHPTMKVSQPQQQQGPTSNSLTILMQQPPLLPQPRPVAAHSSVVPGQPQQTTQLQQFSLQPMPAQQQLLAQPPFQQQGGMVQQGVAMAYPQQGLRPANRPLLQQQYQVSQLLTCRSDLSFQVRGVELFLACNVTYRCYTPIYIHLPGLTVS